jgi:membrane protein implicated in regulation of membrane protease activity
MPQMIFLLLVVGSVWWFFNKFVRDAEKLTRRSEERRKEERNGAQGTLVEDPLTGEYHVKREDE